MTVGIRNPKFRNLMAMWNLNIRTLDIKLLGIRQTCNKKVLNVRIGDKLQPGLVKSLNSKVLLHICWIQSAFGCRIPYMMEDLSFGNSESDRYAIKLPYTSLKI